MSLSCLLHAQIANNYYSEINILADESNQTSWDLIQPLLRRLQEVLEQNPRSKEDKVLSSYLCSCFINLLSVNKKHCEEIIQYLKACLECCSMSTRNIYDVLYYHCHEVGDMVSIL